MCGLWNSAGTCNSVDHEEYLWLGDLPVAAIIPRLVFDPAEGYLEEASRVLVYVHSDHLDTPRSITLSSDTTNQPVWRAAYEPFGGPLAGGSGSASGTSYYFSLRFPGQIYDGNAVRNYNYFRDYDPATGRYLQSDPMLQPNRLITNEAAFYVPLIIQWPQWLQPYSYVTAKPLSEIDPYGLGLWGIIKCMWYGSKMEKYADQCHGECPNDLMGQIKFMQKYQSGFLDDAMLKCTCSRADAAGDKDLCTKFFATCITSPFGGPMPRP